MLSEFTFTRRVDFGETDAAGIVHYSNFFRYMEACEHAFFRSLGTSIVDKSSGIGWPRVQASCDYRKPLYFEDEFTVVLRVTGKTSKSLSYEFIFDKDNIEVARGSLTVCCVRRDETGEMKATEIPITIADKIGIADGEAKD
jgi:YbgC/YbaW family acyl-CoA thioester hydrolase